jgi:hypothetical protein
MLLAVPVLLEQVCWIELGQDLANQSQLLDEQQAICPSSVTSRSKYSSSSGEKVKELIHRYILPCSRSFPGRLNQPLLLAVVS